MIRNDAPPFVRKWLELYGNVPIKTITVCKKPIQKTFDTILNIVSFGTWQQNKDNFGFDDLYHLFLIMEMSDNTVVRLEKNQVLNLETLKTYKPDDATKCINIQSYAPYSLTIGTLMFNAVKKYGPERIYLYDGRTTNCQRFIADLLLASEVIRPTSTFENDFNKDSVNTDYIHTSFMGSIPKRNQAKPQDDTIFEFIMQPTAMIFNNMPRITSLLARGVTDIASIFDRVLYGAGFQNEEDNEEYNEK